MRVSALLIPLSPPRAGSRKLFFLGGDKKCFHWDKSLDCQKPGSSVWNAVIQHRRQTCAKLSQNAATVNFSFQLCYQTLQKHVTENSHDGSEPLSHSKSHRLARNVDKSCVFTPQTTSSVSCSSWEIHYNLSFSLSLSFFFLGKSLPVSRSDGWKPPSGNHE